MFCRHLNSSCLSIRCSFNLSLFIFNPITICNTKFPSPDEDDKFEHEETKLNRNSGLVFLFCQREEPFGNVLIVALYLHLAKGFRRASCSEDFIYAKVWRHHSKPFSGIPKPTKDVLMWQEDKALGISQCHREMPHLGASWTFLLKI